MPGGNGNSRVTPVEVPVSPRTRRPRRSSWAPGGKGIKVAGFVLGAVALLLTVLGAVAGASLFVASKADQSEVDEVRSAVHGIETDVAVIKSELRQLIHALAPDLRVGDE
jgi:hypothetical protein